MSTDQNRNLVILCDESGADLGLCDKLAAHRDGLLNRAFSILIFNESGELLLQRRALGKYHSGGLWANTCCSHDTPGENLSETIHRRLREEMGFDCELFERGIFIYDLDVGEGLREHERDIVFVGRYDGPVNHDPGEVESVRWERPEAVAREMVERPEAFAIWFRKIANRLPIDADTRLPKLRE